MPGHVSLRIFLSLRQPLPAAGETLSLICISTQLFAPPYGLFLVIILTRLKSTGFVATTKD
ncbi:hypothetical protein F4826_003208 [Rahnella inusitata]|nr:hypothetical protein [Rahnella inusitata]